MNDNKGKISNQIKLGISVHYESEKCKLIFAINMTDKGIIFRIYIELL